MRTRRLALFVLSALLVLTAGASASVRSESVTLTAQGQIETLKPSCPAGQRATGGGYRSPSVAEDPYGRFFESRKAGQRAWRVSVFQSGSGSLPVTAFVYCDPNAPRTTSRSKTVEIPAGSGFSSAPAKCGTAGRAQAGGFMATDELADNSGADIYGDILESFRSSRDRWRSTAVAYGSGSVPFTSHVYCADAPLPKARSGSTTALNGVDTARSARCQSGTHVAAGGFSQPDANFIDGYYFLPFELRRAGRRWRTSAEQFGPTNATTLTATAYCVA